ncbi:hypothetical protein DRP43_05960 [candidate division TA06 bacterium]|uniref:Uncharacterized protein n=1 Tax=candidate division TA06 bacterium TaxID=2250710 RepID=A0A660SBS1_UNCT6|nr:MAG: hypothetical protein DRP43_05960 [candidate division TA06 bacterium]
MKKLIFILIVIVSIGCSFNNPISITDKGVFTKQSISAHLFIPDSAAAVEFTSVILNWNLTNPPSFDSIRIKRSSQDDSSNYMLIKTIKAEQAETFTDTTNSLDMNKTYYFKLETSEDEEIHTYSIDFLQYLIISSPSDTISTNDFTISWNSIDGALTDISVKKISTSDTITIWSKSMLNTSVDSVKFNDDSTATDTLVSGNFYNISVIISRGDASTIGTKIIYKY